MKYTFQSITNLLHSLLMWWEFRQHLQKKQKTKKQYSKPHPLTLKTPTQKNHRSKRRACNGAISRAF
jgi:hypothetical protein